MPPFLYGMQRDEGQTGGERGSDKCIHSCGYGRGRGAGKEKHKGDEDADAEGGQTSPGLQATFTKAQSHPDRDVPVTAFQRALLPSGDKIAFRTVAFHPPSR